MGARPRRRRRAAPKSRLRRWLHRQDRFSRFLLVAVAALSVLLVWLIIPRQSENRSAPEIERGTPVDQGVAPARRTPAARIPSLQTQQHARTSQSSPTAKAPTAAPRATRTAGVRPSGPRVAIVIDDLGQNFSHFEQLVDLDIPLTIAVIPGLPASAQTVSEASRRGIEMLLHQPMEPREEGGKNPGEGVLLTSMTAEAVRARVRANLAAVPGAVGVNNHMGSRFTEDLAGLGALMAEIKAHGLFWLDSRTTPGTRGAEVARAVGVPALERDIFIDAVVNADFIRRQVRKLIDLARERGTAVGIGHPHPETIAVLREMRTELLASGVELVPISALVRGNPATGAETALAAAPAGKTGAVVQTADRKTATP